MGDIGPAREIEYEPFGEPATTEPITVPTPAPAEPEKVPA